MRYCLVAINSNKDMMEISNYGILSNNEDFNEESLVDIVNFTNTFSSEEELTETLLKAGFLPKEFIDASYAIGFYRSKTADIKLRDYGISFEDDKKYFNTNYLMTYFQSHLSDDVFMQKFVNDYIDYLRDVPKFSEDLNRINFYVEERHYERHGYVKEDAIEAMRSFVFHYTHTKKKGVEEPKDTKDYNPVLSRIVELAMFAIDHDRFINGIKRNKFKNPNYQKDLELQINHYQMLLDTAIDSDKIEAYTKAINDTRAEYDLVTQDITRGKGYARARRKADDTTEH